MPSMQHRIFRPAALARHASPEGLDALLETTTVPGWISLIALVTVVVGGLVWGVFGRVPQVIEGQGIMVSVGGVFRVPAPAGGQINALLADVGDTVHRGQIVAVLAQPQLSTSIEQLKTSLRELGANRAATAALLERNRQMELASIRQQQAQAEEAIAAADQRLVYLDARIANEREAVDKGLLPRDALENTVAQRAETQLQRLSMMARLQELGAEEVEGQVVSQRSLFVLDQQILQTEHALARDSARLAEFSNARSQYEGVVVERQADVGQSVIGGEPLLTVVPSGESQVLLFIPLEGKRIQAAMTVQMVPGGVRPEETGYFLGEVLEVSPAPLSGAALDRYLKNEVLVQQFTSQGGAYMVAVRVAHDTTTVSGFEWTSQEGAALEFGEGTLVTGKIIVEQTRPVALIMPAIRRWLRG
jgi:HlyD family secretion protein